MLRTFISCKCCLKNSFELNSRVLECLLLTKHLSQSILNISQSLSNWIKKKKKSWRKIIVLHRSCVLNRSRKMYNEVIIEPIRVGHFLGAFSYLVPIEMEQTIWWLFFFSSHNIHSSFKTSTEFLLQRKKERVRIRKIFILKLHRYLWASLDNDVTQNKGMLY